MNTGWAKQERKRQTGRNTGGNFFTTLHKYLILIDNIPIVIAENFEYTVEKCDCRGGAVGHVHFSNDLFHTLVAARLAC